MSADAVQAFDDDDLDDARREWARESLVRELRDHREYFERRVAEIDQALEHISNDM